MTSLMNNQVLEKKANKICDIAEPNQPDNQLCGAVYKDETWKSDYCDEEKEFACKLKSSKLTFNRSGSEHQMQSAE